LKRTSESRPGKLTNIHLMSVTALLVVGVVGLVAMIGQYGGRIPAFAEHADEFRTNISSGLPQIFYFQLLVSSLLAFAMLRYRCTAWQRRWLMLIVVGALTGIYLGGSRSMLFTPILVIMIDLWRRQRVNWWQIGLGMAAALGGIFILGLLRMDSNLERGIYLVRFVADFAPEFREFSKLLTYIPEQTGFLNGQMFVNTALILTPGSLLDLVGMTKADHWLPFGQFLKDLFNYQFAGGGLRAGLIAEYYANFGLTGIIVGFYGLGGLVRYVDSRLSCETPERKVMTLLIALSLGSGVLFTFDAVVYKLAAFGIGWGLYCVTGWSLTALAQPNCENSPGRGLVDPGELR